MEPPPRSSSPGPHDNTKPRLWGAPFTAEHQCIVIFLHGRASSPEEDMPVFEPVLAALDAKLGAIALRAQDEVWFPEDWAAPAAAQEPYASNALDLIHRTIEGLPVPASKVILMGFSQGAALAMTYALKYPRRYGGIISLSGHILGTPSDYPATKASSLEGTPVYIAWGSQDRYMKENRTGEEVRAFVERGGEVELKLFPGMGHFVTQQEVDTFEAMVKSVAGIQ